MHLKSPILGRFSAEIVTNSQQWMPNSKIAYVTRRLSAWPSYPPGYHIIMFNSLQWADEMEEVRGPPLAPRQVIVANQRRFFNFRADRVSRQNYPETLNLRMYRSDLTMKPPVSCSLEFTDPQKLASMMYQNRLESSQLPVPIAKVKLEPQEREEPTTTEESVGQTLPPSWTWWTPAAINTPTLAKLLMSPTQPWPPTSPHLTTAGRPPGLPRLATLQPAAPPSPQFPPGPPPSPHQHGTTTVTPAPPIIPGVADEEKPDGGKTMEELISEIQARKQSKVPSDDSQNSDDS